MIEASGLKMIAVEDFNSAAKTVSLSFSSSSSFQLTLSLLVPQSHPLLILTPQVVNVARISELAGEVSISVDFSTEIS